MKPPMLLTAYKVTKSRNKYGDYDGSSETALACHWRDVTSLVDTGISDTINCDALGWFEAGSGVVKGDVIKFEDVLYKVERLTKARKLRNPDVQFIKCEMNRYKDNG